MCTLPPPFSFGRMNSYPNIPLTHMSNSFHPGNWETFQNSATLRCPNSKGSLVLSKKWECKYFNIVMSVKQAVLYWHSLHYITKSRVDPFACNSATPETYIHDEGAARTCETGRLIKGCHPTAVGGISKSMFLCAQPAKDSTPKACHWSSARKQGCPGTTSLQPALGRQMGGVFKVSRSGMVKHGLMYQIHHMPSEGI